jgi:hypothetical protein
MKTAVIVTTFNRPACLARSLPQIVAAAKEVDAPVLVVDDGSGENIERRGLPLHHSIYAPDPEATVTFIDLPRNRGLAGALNIGLSYWLADPSIEVIHYFQDDVEVDPLAIAACNVALKLWPGCCVTGHDAKEHREPVDHHVLAPWGGPETEGICLRRRESCRATHMSAEAHSWKLVMPIPSRALGLPSRTIRDAHHPERRGTGSGIDWWVVRDSPKKRSVLCIPGLVRTFAWKREDSTWDNEQVAGEDGPLHRDAIRGWVDARS